MAKDLINKPLVEAILELRWKLQETSPETKVDQHYKLFLGRFFDRINDEYPEHKQLKTAKAPDELVGHLVQHQFRVSKDSWPLIQVGPGILTVNSTTEYKWSNDFRPRALKAVSKLFDAYPKIEDLQVSSIILRYINAVAFDYGANNIYSFLQDNLKLSISLPDNLFKDTAVEDKPKGMHLQSTFKCLKPKGRVSIRIASGKKHQDPAVIWDITFESAGEDMPDMPHGFEAWLDKVHDDIIDDWFFKMIEGDLERSFLHE